jgi:nitrogenase-stabilizing/protective protein
MPAITDTLPPVPEDFEDALEELESAEDFLTFFGVPFDAPVVHVNRLHILQRFHDYLNASVDMPTEAEPRYLAYGALLARAYQDFVASDARTEKVFAVFRMHEPRTVNVGLDELLGSQAQIATKPAADHAS